MTVESFLKWKEKFDAEMTELHGSKKRKDEGDKKLTGFLPAFFLFLILNKKIPLHIFLYQSQIL